MMKMHVAFMALFLLISHYVYAQDAEQPQEYIIQKDDTLWDISGNKLQDPFLWPKLWNVNPHIENPDLIHPGDKIMLPSMKELMKEAEAEKESATLPAPEKKKRTVRLKPERETKPTETNSVFTFPEGSAKKYIVGKNLYISSGWIADMFPSIGEVSSSPLGHKSAGENDIVYLKFYKEEPVNKFFAIRDIKIVKHPKTGKKLGQQIRVTGVLEIIGSDSSIPKAKIISSFEEIQVGDGLLPYREMESPLIPVVVRAPQMEGYIVETHMNQKMSGEGNIIFLDKGKNDGLLVGDVFSTISDPPVERATGKIQVISVQPTTSSAVVLKSSEEIFIGGKWGQK
ncbi:MAG: LysM peptidoglycan-binding domain-containing protein [Nitrospirae bacterium]|nr:LysM peptidoglycan-binding domain-containing protein [Nitrospirota bacterium]